MALARELTNRRHHGVELNERNVIGASAHVAGSQIGSQQFHSLLAQDTVETPTTIAEQIVRFMKYSLCRDSANIDVFGMFQATSQCLRERLIDNWYKTNQTHIEKKAKSINYLSMEFLMGRALTNALYNCEVGKVYADSLKDLGFKLEDIQQEEQDAALGNGGLGRLAACFIDSLACLDIPAYGYSIKYDYGMFKQIIENGYQHEVPDYWLKHGTPFPLVERLDREYLVRFGGWSEYKKHTDMKGKETTYIEWCGGELVRAVAYDCLCPGHHTQNVANLRLWSAKPYNEFQLGSHNAGDFYNAVRERAESENISFVLYPNDATDAGKKLRLKQEFFFTSASLQDMLARADEMHVDLHDMGKYFAVQMNDTHPAIGVAELMRLLVDTKHFSWDEAWTVVTAVFGYTNHTVLPEALERWPIPIFQELLPRHLEIIYEINRRFIAMIKEKGVSDEGIRNMSIIDEAGCRYVRMANLAVIGSHAVNGVAALHTEIIKKTIFNDFYKLWPEKFFNMTNGVTPRRWVAQCNPQLAHFITKYLKKGGFIQNELDWVKDMTILKNLTSLDQDVEALEELIKVKLINKKRLAQYIERHCPNCGGSIPETMIFDTQVKRIHEYKRQQLNILQAIAFYLDLKRLSPAEREKKYAPGICKIFAGKAASAYENAKRIIKLICAVGDVVNNDPETNKYLRVVFIPNYNVSNAEIIFPATEVSEQISTAGMEASGTGCMKACMNGGVILGTLDGANVEIQEHVGQENIFIFGALTEDVEMVRARFREGNSLELDVRMREALEAVKSGMFGSKEYFMPLINGLLSGSDYFCVVVDFAEYMTTYLEDLLPTYRDRGSWAALMLHNVARMGFFSSDRTISEYCKKIWDVKPVNVSGLSMGSQ